MQATALYDSLVLFFVPLFGMGVINSETGEVPDMWVASVTSFTAMSFVIYFNMVIRTRYMAWMSALAVPGLSFFMYYAYSWITNYTGSSLIRFAVLKAHQSITFYLVLLLCIGACFTIDFAWEAYRVLIQKTPTDFIA